jgi:integrase
MKEKMKTAYRMYRRKDRGGMFYLFHKATKVVTSLETTDEEEAKRLLNTNNDASNNCVLNRQLAAVFIRNSEPSLATRTWAEAMTELCSHGQERSQKRCKREMDSKAYDLIRKKLIANTTADDLKAVLKRGGSATNNYLRRLHNSALKNGWLLASLIPPNEWEAPVKKPKRGITLEEHNKIISVEKNEERRHYYEMLWIIGAAQTDCSLLTAQNVDWKNRILSYQRKKTGAWCHLSIGTALESLLKQLPRQGFLFPKIALESDNHRAAEFCRRCRTVKVTGVSLHSYRYAWAERAYAAGYEERYAQAALGHASKAVHHAYARRAKVVCPPLENAENKIISLIQTTDAIEPLKKTG